MKCIVCESTDIEVAFHLENGPRYAQKLLDSPDDKGGDRMDVKLYKCCDCGMIQIDPDTLEHDEYFEDYLMSRSCTELYVQYDNELTDTLDEKYGLKGQNIVEVGCGDGFFGELLIQRGAAVSAIEPSATACALAEKRGVTCYNTFLNDTITDQVSDRFDGFVTKQVMDLIKDPNEFLASLGKILKPGAWGLIDVPSWTKTLLDMRYYDVLPDRVGYYTAKTLVEIMERNHFHVVEVFHGAEGEYVGAYVVYEGEKEGLLKRFNNEFEEFNDRFTSLMKEYSDAGKKVAAWGAGAKGVTIFSFSGMTPETIAYVVDKDDFKWNKYLPGSKLKVVSPDTVKEQPVDAVIITGVMFYKEITRQLVNDYGFSGDVILLSPMPRVLTREELDAVLKS
ncbi:class I SAM-dependent methyltransferase [Pseudodesulfovibrio portus]|uniref:SAM-dependent methyltransferase n=1 Tax=Pseudodesulfovibrio portus TaxID=231439 RepID=A0ABM8ANG0_9BACT|nr:class I SAM-dependent methyltransferase [Pseudodesulfovibrio portus]BDQ32903.1 SAM-dependent methyltransferase [Pseudodesulfovibrio portus]